MKKCIDKGLEWCGKCKVHKKLWVCCKKRDIIYEDCKCYLEYVK